MIPVFTGIMATVVMEIDVDLLMKKFRPALSRINVEKNSALCIIITSLSIIFRPQSSEGSADEIKPTSKKTRRGRGESNNVENLKNTNLTILGNNTAGLTGKLESLKRAIEVFQPGVVMLQETKQKKQGKVKLKGFVIFEKLREENEGGGLMSIVHENLKPILIPDEHSEFLVVDISGNFGDIRTINCYGPQENLSVEIRTEFFIELEARIISAKTAGRMICIEFDANSKVGGGKIKGDPNEMSPKWKYFDRHVCQAKSDNCELN